MSEVLKKVPTDEVVAALYNDLRSRVEAVEPNDSMVAPDYADLTLPILVGARCTHNRGLYKCNTQINSSEAWDSTHWDEITVGSELESLQSEVDDKYEKPSGGIPASDLAAGVIPAVPVQDVQIDGTSILNNGVANIPESDSSTLGLVMIGDGLSKNAVTGRTNVQFASDSFIKLGGSSTQAISPARQHTSVFYGLTKAAGVDLASGSDVVGVYPQNAKTAIQTMLGIEADIPLVEEVSGSTPSITGMPNVRYVCGTVSTLSITPPASGSIVVRFTSGSTATLLTVPNTVKFPAWFDATNLDTDMVYELIITDGVYCGVMSWAA